MLKNKRVLITGATRGIGKATAYRFAANGATLILNGRNKEVLEDLKRDIQKQYNVDVHALVYDVNDISAIKQAFIWIKKNVGSLDVLVNDAGILEDALLGMINETQVTNTLSVNTEAVIYHMQYASRLMMKQKQGSIVNISSIIGRTGNEGQVVYAASKAAVLGATYSAAKELAPFNIRVNAIAPGFIETDMTKQLLKKNLRKD